MLSECLTEPHLCHVAEDPKPGPDVQCKRQNGIFPHEYNCGAYYVCKQGVATKTECATGLHLSLDTMECVWPEDANRGACDVPISE